MPELKILHCCGWAELHGVQFYKSEHFHDFLRIATNYQKGAYIFSSAVDSMGSSMSSGAAIFAAQLKSNNLGTVSKIRSFKNPNTGRKIVPYIWIVAPHNLQRYCEKHRI